jgi:hypothetical protein
MMLKVIQSRSFRWHLIPLIFFISFPLWSNEEPVSFIGMNLEELYERFGIPRAVFTVRGDEIWQDDVVFQYNEGEFFIYREMVWQVKLLHAFGISVGDPKQAALLVLGESVEDMGDYLLKRLSGRAWPLMLRINFNNSGRTSAIYLYRPDY